MAAKTCYRVCEPLRLMYKKDGKTTESLTMTDGVFDASEIGVPKAKISEWLKAKRIQKVMVEGKEAIEVVDSKGPKSKSRKKAIWTFKEEELAEMSIEELNMKIQQVQASEKVPKKDYAEVFEDPVKAIEFLTQDN